MYIDAIKWLYWAKELLPFISPTTAMKAFKDSVVNKLISAARKDMINPAQSSISSLLTLCSLRLVVKLNLEMIWKMMQAYFLAWLSFSLKCLVTKVYAFIHWEVHASSKAFNIRLTLSYCLVTRRRFNKVASEISSSSFLLLFKRLLNKISLLKSYRMNTYIH